AKGRSCANFRPQQTVFATCHSSFDVIAAATDTWAEPLLYYLTVDTFVCTTKNLPPVERPSSGGPLPSKQQDVERLPARSFVMLILSQQSPTPLSLTSRPCAT
ncbi:unnamed protein product, partial [Ectocarpus sp. 12 AP-2014]